MITNLSNVSRENSGRAISQSRRRMQSIDGHRGAVFDTAGACAPNEAPHPLPGGALLTFKSVLDETAQG